MTEEQKQEKLAALSYLWTSGEWTLQQTYHSRARVVFVFASGHPSPSELLAVRALVPRFASLPISKVKAEVGRLTEFEVGETSGIAARSLEAKAKRKGLQVRVEDASYTSYLPVSARGAALVIEDHEEAQLAAEEMKRRGVRIIHVECD